MTPAFIKRVMCGLKGHWLLHVRNIYGDEIIFSGYNRSLWRCGKCGAIKLRKELFRAAALEGETMRDQSKGCAA